MDAPLSPQILPTQLSPADPAADARALVALADATRAAVPPVDGAACAAASDDTAPADDSRLSTAAQIDAAEGTVPLVVGSAADISADAAATADDAGAPPTGAAEGKHRWSPGPPSMPLFYLQKASALAARPPPTQWGKQYRRSPALLQVPSPMPRPLTTRELPPHPSTPQRGRQGCRSPLKPQVLLQQVPLPSAPTAAVPLGGYSRRWWRACKGSPPLANDAVVSGGLDTSEQVRYGSPSPS